MARRTREEIAAEVAAASEARRKAYFEAQEKSKAAAAEKLPPVPKPDAYVYSYAWRQGVATPTGNYKLVKTPNPFYDVTTNEIIDPKTGARTKMIPSMYGGQVPVVQNNVVYTNAVDAALANRGWLSIDDPMKSLEELGKIISQYAQPGSSEYVSAFLSAAQMGSRSHTDINGETGTLAKFLNSAITYEQGQAVGIDTRAAQIGRNASVTPGGASSQNMPYTGGASTQNLPYTGGASAQNPPSFGTSPAQTAQAAQDMKERQSAFDVLYSEMDALGLAALVEPLRGLIQKNVSPSEFAVELKQSQAYQNRFAANEVRLKKGLRVLTPGEYIRVEDAYRQTLRSYGLKQFDNDAYVRQFIENDISAAELSDRVSMAVQRVQNADPAVARTLRDYYGIGQTDLVAYVLDPNQQAQKIQRQVAAAEIGTMARRQGIEAGVGVAEQLAAQGITQAEAQRGYATIANILPAAEKLSQIYGATMGEYGLAEAEQEVFNSLASAQRRRERLTQREVAEFSGQSGVGRTSLGGETRGQF